MNPRKKSMTSPVSLTRSSAVTEPDSKDEVDFVKTPSTVCVSCTKNQSSSKHVNNNNITPKLNVANLHSKRRIPGNLYGDCEVTSCVKTHLSTLERLHIFNFQFRKGSDPNLSKTKQSSSTKDKSKFIKSNSIARLFGNTYNTKKSEENPPVPLVRRFRGAEKFFKSSEDERWTDEISLQDFQETNDDLSGRTIKRITRSLGKLLRRNCSSVDISIPDPEYKVSYLGNVLTGWAKGDACMEKPLATLWRNYTQNNKPDVLMRLQVCPSGLKATTRQHGLTEYWAHRVTHCCSPKNYPKVFCWIYRHEGRRLKHELRCHAVICSKETIAQEISTRLKENLVTALREFKRDKISKQNARLSLANAVYDNPSMPRRKILLSVGANHYRPPLERSKSAPKLMAIEEIIGEEEEEEERDNIVAGRPPYLDHQRPCCKEDLLYSASTFGRRHCRRGHSLRRAKLRNSLHRKQCLREVETFEEVTEPSEVPNATSEPSSATAAVRSLGSESDDDFEEFLLSTNYNSKEPLSGEFISYLDMKLKPTTVSLHDLYQPTEEDEENCHLKYETIRNTMSLDDLNDYCTDGDEEEDADDVFYSHDHVMEVLHHQKQYQHSMSAPTSMSTPSLHNEQSLAFNNVNERTFNVKTDNSLELTRSVDNDVSCPPSLICVTKLIGNLDSDESSISSGCETSSTVTTTTETMQEVDPPKRCSVLERVRSFEQLAENKVNCTPVGEKRSFDHRPTASPQQYSKLFQRSITFPGPGGVMRSNFNLPPAPIAAINKQLISQLENVDADSDVSDESGYVEFQENTTCKVKSIVT